MSVNRSGHCVCKDRRKIAIVATAHDLVRVMWSMLKKGTLWTETVKAT